MKRRDKEKKNHETFPIFWVFWYYRNVDKITEPSQKLLTKQIYQHNANIGTVNLIGF